MCTGSESGGRAAPDSATGRREFLRNALLASALALLPNGRQLLAHPEGGIALTGKGASSAPPMAAAARAFLRSLDAEQRGRIAFAFEDERRLDWNYRPKASKELLAKDQIKEVRDFLATLPKDEGVSVKELDASQRRLLQALLRAGTSPAGFWKATNIMSLNELVKERDPLNPVWENGFYYASVFGTVGGRRPWGWRLEGHHLSLNYTVVNGRHVVSSPTFLGALPALVQHGPRKGLRVLAGEELLARKLLKALDDGQRRLAVVSEAAPRDIITGVSRKAVPLEPAGLRADRLSQQQADVLMSLLKEYVGSMPADVARARLDKLRSAGFNSISFAWAGGFEPGQPHYYRIQGPSFLVEYDNTQSNVNHIHTVWRDFNGDFGLDLLAEHHKTAHR